MIILNQLKVDRFSGLDESALLSEIEAEADHHVKFAKTHLLDHY